MFFTSLLKCCDEGCLVVTESFAKKLQYFSYSVLVQYTKVAEVLEIMHFN